jgi:site-specific DNA-methyltransferase (adenine-specific)
MADPNWKNRTIWTRDNLEVLRGMNSESVDLIYLDPPFNSKRNYAAPIGSRAAGAAFKDTWTFDDVDRLWLLLLREKEPRLFQGRAPSPRPSF